MVPLELEAAAASGVVYFSDDSLHGALAAAHFAFPAFLEDALFSGINGYISSRSATTFWYMLSNPMYVYSLSLSLLYVIARAGTSYDRYIIYFMPKKSE